MDKTEGATLITENGARYDIQPITTDDITTRKSLGDALANAHVDDVLRLTWGERTIYAKVINIE